MADSKQLVKQLVQEHAVSNKTSRTAAGQTDTSGGTTTEERINTINQVFALFRLNYHNQYFSAFPDSSEVDRAKRLWLETLSDYPIAQILGGAKRAIETSEYLPTLHRMIECCQQGMAEYGLPVPREAYKEACNAASPRSAQRWSHPAVYLAGRDSGWFLLAGSDEHEAWPVFRYHYQLWCNRALAGEPLEIPAPEALEQLKGEPLSKEEQLAELKKLRRETGI